jgi:hypothetical protein
LTGAGLNTNPNSYVWGHATNVLPGNPDLLLIQSLESNGAVVPFEQTADAIDSFELVKLTSTPSWSDVASWHPRHRARRHRRRWTQ